MIILQQHRRLRHSRLLALFAVGSVLVLTVFTLWAAHTTVAAAELPAPRPYAPENGSTLSGDGAAVLAWDSPPGATQFHIQVTPANGDGPGVNAIIGEPAQVGRGLYTVHPPRLGNGQYLLLPDMTYTWHVRVSDTPEAIDEASPQWGPWSQPFTFRTAVRDSSRIRLTVPEDGATMGDAPATLRWENADADVFYYEVQASTDPAFETDPGRASAGVWWNLVHGGATALANSWVTPALEPGRAWYWRVRPRVQGDGTPVAWSQASRFRTVRVETVAENVAHPWELAFAPDGRLFFTDRPDTVRVLLPEGAGLRAQTEPVLRVNAVPIDEGGVRGLVLDPDFTRNGHLYLYATYSDGDSRLWNRLSRFTEKGGKAGEERVLLDRIPGSRVHNAGRLGIGPDGKLYVTTGETGNGTLAQDPASLAGKVLRLNRDGSIPADNPFPGSPVYSLGHRNAQGLAWHPQTGALFQTEHGPSLGHIEGEGCCHDEVNIIRPGQNYGWPLFAGVSNDSRFTDPLLESGEDTWAPAGAAFLRSPASPEWNNNLFFATLRGLHLHRLVLGGPDQQQVLRHERLFERQYGRLRAVAPGPDGYLYFSTSNGGSDRILRVRLGLP